MKNAIIYLYNRKINRVGVGGGGGGLGCYGIFIFEEKTDFYLSKKKEKTNFCVSLTISQPLAPPSTSTEVFDMHHTICSHLSPILLCYA